MPIDEGRLPEIRFASSDSDPSHFRYDILSGNGPDRFCPPFRTTEWIDETISAHEQKTHANEGKDDVPNAISVTDMLSSQTIPAQLHSCTSDSQRFEGIAKYDLGCSFTSC